MPKYVNYAGERASPEKGEAVLSGIQYNSTVDGNGVRTVLFFSGCRHNCPGCQNPQTHDFLSGRVFSEEIQLQILDTIEHSSVISGITLSGGDPMYSAAAIAPFVKRFKEAFPDKDVWAYTGFVFEDLLCNYERLRLLQLCDVLIDGPFIEAEADEDILFRGSRNQRIIDVNASLAYGCAMLKDFG